MRILLIALLLAGSLGSGEAPSGAWLPVQLKWQHAPASVNANLITAAATVLYFQADGRFAMIDCFVNREPGHYTTISHGDGQIISAGNWSADAGRVILHYRTVFRTVPITGEQLPGQWHEQTAVWKDADLVVNGKSYRRNRELDESAAESLPSERPPIF
jgi:hypothetical protein